MFYLTLKSLHIIMMVTWFAGLFYLPRLFVYHAMVTDLNVRATFKTMERKLLVMMHIGAITTIVLGIWLLQVNNFIFLKAPWMHVKLTLLVLLVIYHHICMIYVKQFAQDRCHKSHVFFRFFNEVPVIFLIGIVLFAVLKPTLF